jgi:MYXO-CTERM domain-containing protein
MRSADQLDQQDAPLPYPWLRLALFGGVLLAGAVLLLVAPPDGGEMRGQVAAAGAWAGVAFVGAYVVATLLVLPKNVLSVVAGALFGPVFGVVLVWLAATVGAAAAFWVGRVLGRDGVRRLVGRHLDRLDRLVERHGVLAVLVARLIPVIPFTAVNYGSGLTAVRFGPYLLATGVGIVPGTVAYVVLGAYGSDPGSWPFLASLTALVLLAGLGLVVGWRRRRRRA